MATAFGAVGGMIGSAVAPLAAALTGAAGAAGQSLSLLSAADSPAADEMDETRIAEGLPDTDPADGDRGFTISEAGPGDDDPVLPEDVAESEESEQQSRPRSAATPEQARPPVPPAATRPPH